MASHYLPTKHPGVIHEQLFTRCGKYSTRCTRFTSAQKDQNRNVAGYQTCLEDAENLERSIQHLNTKKITIPEVGKFSRGVGDGIERLMYHNALNEKSDDLVRAFFALGRAVDLISEWTQTCTFIEGKYKWVPWLKA